MSEERLADVISLLYNCIMWVKLLMRKAEVRLQNYDFVHVMGPFQEWRSNWRNWLGFCDWESLCFDLLMYKNKLLRCKQWSKVMANNYYQLDFWMASVSFLLTNNAAVNSFFQAGHLDSLTSSEFVGLTRMVEDFVLDCEQICGRQSHSLRATLLTQAKKFVERFHEERKNKLRYCTWCIIRVLWEKL